MKREEIKSIVIEEISKIVNDVPEHDIEDMSLSDDLGMDSLDSVELVLQLEKRLDISFPDNEETEELKTWTIKELIDYVQALESVRKIFK